MQGPDESLSVYLDPTGMRNDFGQNSSTPEPLKEHYELVQIVFFIILNEMKAVSGIILHQFCHWLAIDFDELPSNLNMSDVNRIDCITNDLVAIDVIAI